MASGSRTLRTRRDVVRRHRRERQFLVFGLLVGVLAAIFAIALAVYQDRIDSPIQEAFVTPDPEFASDITVPCPPSGAEDSLPLQPDQVTVRVRNAKGETGLATNTLAVLEGRGYVGVGATNWDNRTYAKSVRIQFGEEGLRAAYTVARNFTDVEYVLDTRKGKVVDVIVGTTFDTKTGIRPQYAPELDPDQALEAPPRCLPLASTPKQPAPRIIPKDPLAPVVTPTPSPSPSPSPSA